MIKGTLSIILILGIGMSLFSQEILQEDLYVNKSVKQMILLLGEPTAEGFRVIDDNYRGYESEPDYSLFFSLEERRATITIMILEWERRNDNIVVWAKRVDDEWVVFSSLSRRNHVVF
jgi:hypothetical protein